MKGGPLYWSGTVTLTLLGVLAGWLAGNLGKGIWLSTGTAFLVQAPLGWWLVGSIGKPLFIGVWAVGMLARFLLLGVFGLLVLPMLEWPLMPGLLSLATMLFGFLLVECLVLWVERARIETA